MRYAWLHNHLYYPNGATSIILYSGMQNANILASSPCHAANVKKLLGSENVYRLRVADWRIVYVVEDERLLISIVKIDVR